MWDIDSGLLVVRMIQQDVRQYGYHVTIGGGVVNNGFSNKDLDLYFLPMGGFNPNDRRNPNGLIEYLEGLWGSSQSLGKGDAHYSKVTGAYRRTCKFFRNKQERIDCFIF